MSRDPDDRQRVRGTQGDSGIGAKSWLLIACGVLLLLLFLLNLQKVEVHLLIATVDMPLILALVIAAILGLALGWAVPRRRTSRRG